VTGFLYYRIAWFPHRYPLPHSSDTLRIVVLTKDHHKHPPDMKNNAGELLTEEFKLAQNELSSITGEFSNEDLLGRIFADFCIGK
jgi:tRNA U34 5-carboxymethylaminomethyl modifying GTPase MnmE/TrmE